MAAGADLPSDSPIAPVLLDVLSDAQRQGFIGPGPLEPHVVHALGFADALTRARGRTAVTGDHVVDLGAGGGLPGLALAFAWPGVRLSLVEGSARRGAFLVEVIGRCRLQDHVDVIVRRAELVGRDEEFRGRCSLVVCRAFGNPAETAECAAPFLDIGGLVVVSEPPEARGEAGWPPEGLSLLGLEWVAPGLVTSGFAVFQQVRPCPERYPRRVGVPRKRPLF
jgi:16S rRNA (guanine527-N7)-methyltransferase